MAVVDILFCIETANLQTLVSAKRLLEREVLINSVNLEENFPEVILPLVQEYDSAVIAAVTVAIAAVLQSMAYASHYSGKLGAWALYGDLPNN